MADCDLPPPISASAEYTATINGRPVRIFTFAGFAGGSVNWIQTSLDPARPGPLVLRVTTAREVDEVTVHPIHAGVEAELEGRVATVVLERAGHYFLKWDGAFQLPLYVFVHPAPIGAPEPRPNYTGAGAPEIGGWANAAAPGVIAFGPGVHRPGRIRLHSGNTLYLAPGAEVYGTVVADHASDLRICGEGILRGSHIPFQGDGESWHMISLRGCRRVLIEGITVLDGFSWNIVFVNCEDVRVRWTQVIAERLYSTDGINPCGSRRVAIEDCFIRTKDDCVAVKGFDWERPDPRDWEAIHDIAVRRCVLWSDNNNAIVVGCETRASVIERVSFEDCDVLSCSNTCGDGAGVLAVIALDDTRIRDIAFRRIRVEHTYGPLFNVHFSAGIFGIPDRRLPGGGCIGPVVFEDIELLAGPSRRSFVRGLDESRRVGPVVFRRVRLRGRPVLGPADMRLTTNQHVVDIKVEPAGGPAILAESAALGREPVLAR